MYTFNWALTAFRSESYIGSATALPDIHLKENRMEKFQLLRTFYQEVKGPQKTRSKPLTIVHGFLPESFVLLFSVMLRGKTSKCIHNAKFTLLQQY